MRLVIARCSVDYVGRLTAHLPSALRLLIVKADGSVLVHSDGGSYKPLNWMSPPCRLTEEPGKWSVTNKAGETLAITITEVLSDTSVDLGVDPGLVKDGVEAHLQELLAVQLDLLGEGWRLVRREYPTPIGPVDLMCRNEAGQSVAVEIKRRGEIDGVEQLTRYLDLLNRDPLLAPVHGIFAAQEIKLQARTLAKDRGIRCVTLDYERCAAWCRRTPCSDGAPVLSRAGSDQVGVDRPGPAGQPGHLGDGHARGPELFGALAVGEQAGLAPGEDDPRDARRDDVLDAGHRARRAGAAGHQRAVDGRVPQPRVGPGLPGASLRSATSSA